MTIKFPNWKYIHSSSEVKIDLLIVLAFNEEVKQKVAPQNQRSITNS